MSRRIPAASLAFALALSLAACEDDPSPGALAVAASGGEPGREATIDFGGVKMGASALREFTVSNVGVGPITLVALEHASGEEVRIDGGGGGAAVWSVPFVPGTVVQPGGQVKFTATFRPPTIGVASSPHAAQLRLIAEDAAPDSATAFVSLVGTGLSGDCAVPPTVDFGYVAFDDVAVQRMVVENPTAFAARVTVGNITSASGDHGAFFFPAGSEREFDVPGKSSVAIPIHFRPFEEKTYVAQVLVQAAAQCAAQNVTLTGRGVESTLTWTPAQVDFQYASPGTVVTRNVIFQNLGRADAHLSAFKAINALEFGVGDGPDEPITALTVPAGAAVALPVWTKPAALGLRQSFLQFVTDVPLTPSGTIVLRVLGGGPDIEVTPSPAVAFGKVAWFGSAPAPAFQKRRLTVRNVGSTIPQLGDASNLRLGIVDGAGNVIPGTYFDVTPTNAQTAADEFTVEFAQAYDPAFGIAAPPAANAVELLVKFTPASSGLKQAELTIHSTDPDEPEVRLALSAEAVVLPPCKHSLSASSLDFGMVSPPESREQSVTLTNLGTAPGEICLVSALELGALSHPALSLRSGAIESRELQPGESMEAVVRMRPSGATPVSIQNVVGSLGFYLSSPTTPAVSIALTGQLGPSCLVVAPDEWSFGSVTVGCRSDATTFRMFNRCPAPIHVSSVRIAGAPVTDPGCTATASCPFSLLSSGVGAGGVSLSPASASVSFQVAHNGNGAGEWRGAVLVNATEGGTAVRYRVPVDATGTTSTQHADTFDRPLAPAADVLLVVSNAPGAATRQLALANGFNWFIQYAVNNQVSYHLGVVTTDVANASSDGQLVTGTAHPESVLTDATANVEAKFKAKVAVGTAGSWAEKGLASASIALSAPVVNGVNKGFLRDAADLSVFAFSLMGDWSPLTASQYLDALWNIKGHNARHRFTFNVMGPFGAPSCGGFDNGGRYASVTSASGGRAEDVCATSLNAGLGLIGANATGLRSSFFLTSQPASAAQIQVALNGVAVPAVSGGATAWTYDALSNRVNMQTGFIPGPGDTLTVTYPATCH